VIDHLTFAIYLTSNEKMKSNIKFGSYDVEGIDPTTTLTLIRTVNTTSWALKANDFKIGSIPLLIYGDRQAIIEPSSPFIYVPGDDFQKIARALM